MPFLHSFLLGFSGALLASGHCLGMCGGFVVSLSDRRSFRRQLLWHAGRIFTYLFLGSLAGYAGGILGGILAGRQLQNLLGYVAAAVIVAAGLRLMGFLPYRGGGAGGALPRLAGALFHSSSPGAPLLLGVATGFLPCPIVLAFLAYGIESESVVTAAAALAGVGAGSALPLLAFGSAARLVVAFRMRWHPRVAGIILLVLGAATALRATELFHRALPCPKVPLTIARQAQQPCEVTRDGN